MQKYVEYIEEIEIDSLWSGKRHIKWQLNRQVNVLSGVNGMGKSTILNKVIKCIPAGGDFTSNTDESLGRRAGRRSPDDLVPGLPAERR